MKTTDYTFGITISLLFFFSTTFASTIERKVHYKLQKNEIIFYDEYVASLKFDDQSFACIVEDTTTNIKTFVWNGQKKISCDYISCYYIDLNDYDKCIIYYRQGENRYLKIKNQLHGPYEGISYPLAKFQDDDPRTNGYTWHLFSREDMKTWFYKNCFWFKQMNRSFLYIDGSVSPMHQDEVRMDTLQRSYGRNCQQQPIFKSLDKKHTAILHPTYILLDNVPYKIPLQPNDSIVGCELYIFDDGACYGELSIHDAKSFQPKEIIMYIANNSMKILTSDKTFNFKKRQIDSTENIEKSVDYQLFFRNTFYNDREYQLIDTSEKHYLISNTEYPYVMVDNEKYGKECAIYAWYEKETNAFCWITLEGNELVSYCYKL